MASVDQHRLTVTMDNDDLGDRPTLPSLRSRQRPKARPRQRERFDAPTEHFFSNVETLPEFVVDAALVALMTTAVAPAKDDEVTHWWAAQRRIMHLRMVAGLIGLSVALLFASALLANY